MKNKNSNLQEELYLAKEMVKIENSEEIAELSLKAEKYPFIIKYDVAEKDIIITELAKLGCDEIKQLDFANCIAVCMSMTQLKAIKTLAGVEAVERDYDYKCLVKDINKIESTTYLASNIDDVKNREEVKLAIFDTGVSNVSIDSSVNFINNSLTDENGHGTQMAGIISSIVDNAENKIESPYIYSVVVADHRGLTKTSTIMQALQWAIDNKIKIICMSFGDYHKSVLLENMIKRAAKCGIIMVAAAGNDGGFEDENRIMYPAAFNNVLSVGAKNGNAVASYSNGGEKADCFANGLQNTIDINGNAVNVIGTSGAAAFTAGTVLKNWCMYPKKTSADIIADIKKEMSISDYINTAESLTKTIENDMIMEETKNVVANVTELNSSYLTEDISALSIEAVGDNEYSSNSMTSAINIPFFSWQSASISCPGNEIWYKFTTNVGEAHPNGSRGWYGIQTQGSLDTQGYLYDAYGNQMDYDDDGGNNLNFKITHQLEYGETYYVKVRAFGNNTGSFHIKVDYGRDEHGNTMSTATEISGVYYQDKSVNGYLHSYSDADYYTFVPERNCVMEIYTEGDTNTYGQLYCESGGLLDSDDSSNGNGNFKITAHLEAMKRYYIAVSHTSSTGYGDYTLRFKFVKDYCDQIVDEQYRVMCWYADNQDEYPEMGTIITRSKVFISNRAKLEFEIRVIEDRFNQKTGLISVLNNGTAQDVLLFLLDTLISFVPVVGDMLSYAINIASILCSYMSTKDLLSYQHKTELIENTNQYIIGEHYWYEGFGYPDDMPTGEYNFYSTGAGFYYGKEYQRGQFAEINFKQQLQGE